MEVLHWDGRLDNRSELLLRLSLNGESTNQAIACATYDRWGTEGLVHLIGDWSLVIRDHLNSTTILASDFAGVRPLYYHVQDGRVQWSNRLQSLVEETGPLAFGPIELERHLLPFAVRRFSQHWLCYPLTSAAWRDTPTLLSHVRR